MTEIIYHITNVEQWQDALINEVYQPKQFIDGGFIHCSYKHQLIKVANRFFKGQNNLVILAIDSQKIASKIVAENLEGETELFPHIYGKLPLNAVLNVSELSSNVDGTFYLPRKLY